MIFKIMDHAYIALTIFFTVYSQLIFRWRASLAGNIPEDFTAKIGFVFSLIFDPWILSGVIATFFAGVSWIIAMTKFDISYAYPFVSLSYIFILAAGFLLFNESLSVFKLVGSLLVVVGIIIIAKG